MRNIAKKHHDKFDPDTKRNDGALGFFQRASPPNKKKMISSVWGRAPGPTVPGPKIYLGLDLLSTSDFFILCHDFLLRIPLIFSIT